MKKATQKEKPMKKTIQKRREEREEENSPPCPSRAWKDDREPH